MHVSQSQDEKSLLQRIAGGDQAAFSTLFDEYHPPLAAFVFGITRSREVAEEVVMDTFLKIWMTREVLDEVENFRAYLFTVSKNAAVSALRGIIRQRENKANWQKLQITEPTEDTDHKEVYLGLIDQAINQLSPQRKKIYLLSRREGLKYEEIAKLTGLSRFTVRAHIQQSVAFIIQFLKSRLPSQLLVTCILINF